jgi:hypothetical protein
VCFLSPGGQTGAIVFTGIFTGTIGLEIALYSQNSYLDTLGQLIKMILPVKRPYEMFTDYLLDLLGEKLRQDPDKQSCKGKK